MTDNEIIKALKSDIRLADYIDSDYCGAVDKALIQSAINSINRLQAKVIKEQNKNSKLRNERNHLQAEIERLNKVYQANQQLINALNKSYFLAKAEAYKEFAKLLRRQAFDGIYVSVDEINNLLKEMVGDDNAEEKE